MGGYALYTMSPLAKQAMADKAVFVEPIARSEMIETLLSQNTVALDDVVQIQTEVASPVPKVATIDTPIVLLNEPKLKPIGSLQKEVVERVEVVAAKPAAVLPKAPVEPVSAIQNDLDQLFPE